jgi:hypothetical protein
MHIQDFIHQINAFGKKCHLFRWPYGKECQVFVGPYE